MTIQEIRKEREAKQSKLIEECRVFFAFSNKQFDEGKTPLQEGEKYVSMGMGGYIPRNSVQAYIDGMKRIEKEYKQSIKDNKQREALILYELHNHEAFYTGNIEDVKNVLGEDYTYEEVKNVYNKNYTLVDL